jgi:rhodanese-related sulfurtransferase
MPLPDEVIVYPAHGAGSACGKNMSKETSDTLGNQKQNNYALRADMSKEEFIKEVTDGLMIAPQYFPKNALMNKEGYESIDTVYDRGLVALAPNQLEELVNETGALVLDTRSPQVFKDGFIPNAVNIGIDGSFAPWVGALIIDLQQPIVLVTEEGREKEVITRLSRVGYDHVLGYLEGGIQAWQEASKELDTIASISATEFAQIKEADDDIKVLDARKPNEYQSEHVIGAENFPLDYINDNLPKIDKSAQYYIHCAGGYRSMIATSILKARGFENLVDVAGGFKAIAETDVPKSAFVCPSTLK